MEIPTTAEAFVAYVLSPAGLGVIVSLILGLLKKYVKGFPEVMDKFGGYITVGVAAVVAVLGYLVSISGVIPIVENYWFLVVLVFGMSQGVYAGAKQVGKHKNGG